MKIYSITTSIENIELKTPFKTALRTTSSVEFVRVCINGEFFGEAPATKAITGEDLKSISQDIKSVKELLFNKTSSEALKLLHTLKIGSSAKAAIDIALHYMQKDFFKVQDPTPIQTDITISLDSFSKMLADAKLAFSSGCDKLKVKVGSDVTHAIEVVKTIAKELPLAKILVDANQAWSKSQSFEFIEQMRGVSIELIEQPVVAKDLKSLKEITAYSHIPILADEAVFSLEDVKNVWQSKSANMINIKLMKCGGVGKAIEILEFARAKGIKCMLGSMLEGPYSINAAIYLAFAYRDVVAFVDLDSPLLYKELPLELEFSFSGSFIKPQKK